MVRATDRNDSTSACKPKTPRLTAKQILWELDLHPSTAVSDFDEIHGNMPLLSTKEHTKLVRVMGDEQMLQWRRSEATNVLLVNGNSGSSSGLTATLVSVRGFDRISRSMDGRRP
jgi:hypothetical protein